MSYGGCVKLLRDTKTGETKQDDTDTGKEKEKEKEKDKDDAANMGEKTKDVEPKTDIVRC